MVVRRSLAGALAAPLLLLAACGGGADSIADPPISSAPTSSPTKPPKQESIESFIRRWVNEDTRMQNTGNTAEFRSMSKGCDGCDAVADRIEAIYKAGGRVRTDGWSLLRSYQSAHHGKTRTIELLVDSAPTAYTPSAGASLRHLQGGREHFQVRLIPTAHSWLVTQFVQVDS